MDGYINVVPHHLTDKVSVPAWLFSPWLFFLPPKKKDSHNYPQSPAVYTCQRLDCCATNQPLSGNDGALKATDSRGTGGTFTTMFEGVWDLLNTEIQINNNINPKENKCHSLSLEKKKEAGILKKYYKQMRVYLDTEENEEID